MASNYTTTVATGGGLVTIGGYDGHTSQEFVTLDAQQVAHLIAQLSGALVVLTVEARA